MTLNVGHPLLENTVENSVVFNLLTRKEAARYVVLSSIFSVIVSADRISCVAQAALGFESILGTRILCGPGCLVLHWHFHFTVASLHN